MMGDEIKRMNLKETWRKLEKELQEGCAGGVCSVGAKNAASSNFSHSGDGTKVASLHGMTREQEYQTDGKIGVEPMEPNTKYKDPDARPFTAEEEFDPYWSGYYMEVGEDGYTAKGKKPTGEKMEEMEIRTDDPTHTANDLAHNYAAMTAVQDELGDLKAVTDHFKNSGQQYDIMIRVGETTKSVQEWIADFERNAGDGLDPEVPSLPPTEGGFSPEDTPADDLGSQMPFPEMGEPNI